MSQEQQRPSRSSRPAARSAAITTQRATLIGLELNHIGHVAEVPDTPSTRGMLLKVRHLVEVMEGD